MPGSRAAWRRIGLIAATAIVVVGGGIGIAAATSSFHSTAPNGHHGRGMNEYGMTKAYYKGHRLGFTYTHGYYCDTSVHSSATSKCEAGATYKKAPAKNFDPLYITVPLGFTRAMTECPSNLICVDHPGTIDLRRLEPALKPLYPGVSKKQLLKALSNATVPGHDHFITTKNNKKPEWWDVKIVGVTSPTTYKHIIAHKSYGYIAHLLKHKNAHVVGPIPTNLFLYFGVN